ncbi:MAG: DNA cytosine methyltransferase, partial [Bacteroidales bacterium]|nr:DNA cytosine methyltransferase [Bacteroidales bacterium]
MDVGFERPGIKVVFANEVMKEAAQTYILIDFRAFYGLDKFSLK